MTRCALVVGHKPASPGAAHEDGHPTEYEFNDDLAWRIVEAVSQANSGLEVVIVHRQPGLYRQLPDKINVNEPDFIISLHCNAFRHPAKPEYRASGSEVLHYHTSATGKKMADRLLVKLVDALELPNRGAKPRDVEQRGGYLLRYTRAPAVIAEPFFIDNEQDYGRAIERRVALIAAYAEAICEFAAG